MPLATRPTGLPTPQILTTCTPDLIDHLDFVSSGNPGSTTWPVATSAFFMPVVVDQTRTYVRAFWLNGATVAGNVDVGLYTLSGTNTMTRQFSTGAVAQAGASVMQTVTINWTVTPGLYYLAQSLSLATATTWRSPSPGVVSSRPAGILYNAASHPLGATVTVGSSSTAGMPFVGLSELATI